MQFAIKKFNTKNPIWNEFNAIKNYDKNIGQILHCP